MLLVLFPLMEINQVSRFPCSRDTARGLGSSGRRWPHERTVGSPVWGLQSGQLVGGGPGGRSALASRWERVPGTAVGLALDGATRPVPGVFPALPSMARWALFPLTTEAPSHSPAS